MDIIKKRAILFALGVLLLLVLFFVAEPVAVFAVYVLAVLSVLIAVVKTIFYAIGLFSYLKSKLLKQKEK